MPNDVPFGDDDIPEPIIDVLAYADDQNPGESWDVCCVCEAVFDPDDNGHQFRLWVRGLGLLSDGTLARVGWCGLLKCQGDRYSSPYIPLAYLKEFIHEDQA